MAELSKKIGEMAYDGLVTDTKPAVIVAGGTLLKLAAETTLKRGTLLAKSASTGKLVIFGTTADQGDTLTADCILCDDTKVGTAADVKAPVYIAGCFDPDKLVIAEGATITEAVKDTLRTKGIILKAAAAAN
jgi:hypothetical protein